MKFESDWDEQAEQALLQIISSKRNVGLVYSLNLPNIHVFNVVSARFRRAASRSLPSNLNNRRCLQKATYQPAPQSVSNNYKCAIRCDELFLTPSSPPYVQTARAPPVTTPARPPPVRGAPTNPSAPQHLKGPTPTLPPSPSASVQSSTSCWFCRAKAAWARAQ